MSKTARKVGNRDGERGFMIPVCPGERQGIYVNRVPGVLTTIETDLSGISDH